MNFLFLIPVFRIKIFLFYNLVIVNKKLKTIFNLHSGDYKIKKNVIQVLIQFILYIS